MISVTAKLPEPEQWKIRPARRRFANGSNVTLVVLLAAILMGNCSAAGPEQNAAEAQAALRSGDYAGAREGFEAVLRSQPDQEPSQIGLLQALRESGAYEEACRRGDEFLKVNAKSAGLLLERGRSAVAVGDYEAAENHLRRALIPGALRRTVASELAFLLDNVGRQAEAEALWDGLLDEYREGRVAGRRDLGVIAFAGWRRGYIQDAKDIFIDATGEQPDADTPLEALSNFGYLFLEKYNATDAISVFRDCLKINPAYPPALLGMALAKVYESSREVETFALASLKVNPNFVPALNLLAELRIQEEQYEEAYRLIRRALSVNSRDLESLSLEAVYRQIRNDEPGFAGVERKILAIHPSYGKLYYTLAENLVMRRKYRESVDYYNRAVALSPKLFEAYAGMGMNLMRIGDLKEGRAMVERAFNLDPFNIWAFNTLDLLDQMDQFATVASGPFIFRMAKEDEGILTPYATKLAQEAYDTLSRRYGFSPQQPLQVEIFPDHGGFAVRTLGLPGLGALGVCFGSVVAMDSPRARRAGVFNWGTTLWHEFVHVITLQVTRHNIPRWYSEGLSVYEEQKARPGWGDDLTASFVKAYKEGNLLKVSELNAGMMRPKSPEQIELSYYQAGLFCSMIEEKFGFEKIRQSLQLFAENKPSAEVFLETLGWDEATVDRQYASFLDSKLKEIASRLDFEELSEQAASGGPPSKSELEALLRRNPDDFFANLQLGALLREEKSHAEAETRLKKAETLFPSFVEPDNPYQLLSEMYLEQGREEDALEQLIGWTRYDETAVEPLNRAAEIYRKRKDWSAQAKALELSIFIDPYDSRVHGLLAEAALASENWTAAIAACQVLLTLNPPDPAEAHYNLALAWLGAGKKAEAKKETLRALEIAPTFEKAQLLLLKLTGGVS